MSVMAFNFVVQKGLVKRNATPAQSPKTDDMAVF